MTASDASMDYHIVANGTWLTTLSLRAAEPSLFEDEGASHRTCSVNFFRSLFPRHGLAALAWEHELRETVGAVRCDPYVTVEGHLCDTEGPRCLKTPSSCPGV